MLDRLSSCRSPGSGSIRRSEDCTERDDFENSADRVSLVVDQYQASDDLRSRRVFPLGLVLVSSRDGVLATFSRSADKDICALAFQVATNDIGRELEYARSDLR